MNLTTLTSNGKIKLKSKVELRKHKGLGKHRAKLLEQFFFQQQRCFYSLAPQAPTDFPHRQREAAAAAQSPPLFFPTSINSERVLTLEKQ